ncbi:hypothetical protein ACLK2E_19480 [Escherichia coli]
MKKSGHWPVLYLQERPGTTLCLKRHRITLLFNANKAYDRQVVEGVGEYLQASQLEWDIFIEEDFRARIENIKEWLGDGVIADYDDPEIETAD